MVSARTRSEQACYAIGRGLSQRRACALLSISRSNLTYVHKMPEKDVPVINAMKALSGTYPRFGSRRIRVFLQRNGIQIGKERCSRLSAKAGLQVPKKRRRKVAGQRFRPVMPTARNSVWSYDFVYDACANGQKIKCLTVIDVLTRLMSLHGVPRHLRSDNGPEFVSKALLEWTTQQSLELVLIEPGKPWQNGANESFNGKFRDECLSMEWFRHRLEAKMLIEDWRLHYNNVRPHSSLNYETPSEFKLKLGNYLTIGANFSM